MKPQDILFLLIFVLLIYQGKPKNLAIAGIFCFVAAVPLFATWVFFTAERLTWYAAAFLACSILISTLRRRTVQ